MSIPVRIVGRARHSGRQIQSAGEPLRNSGQLSNLSHVGVAQIKVQIKGSVLRRYIPFKVGTDVEVRRSVTVNKGPIASREVTAGILDSARECVPMNRTRGDTRGRRQNGVKVVDFKIRVAR